MGSRRILQCSEIKAADQPQGHGAADVRLCFRICKNKFSHDEALLAHPVNYVLHLGVNLRLLVLVPLRNSIGGVAKCVGDVKKVHSCTHKKKRVLKKKNKAGQNEVMFSIVTNKID